MIWRSRFLTACISSLWSWTGAAWREIGDLQRRPSKNLEFGCIIRLLRMTGLFLVLGESLGAVLDRLHRDLGAFPPDDLQFFVLKLIGRDEELLKLLLNLLRKVPNVAKALLRVGAPGHREQAVFRSAFPLLFCSI